MPGEFERLFVAATTPYRPGTWAVDEAALREHLRYFLRPSFVETGSAVVVGTEVGDVFYLTREEKRRNVEIAVEECGGKVPVVAGVIAPTTEECVAVARDAREAGADGILLIPPMGTHDITSSWNAELYPEVWIDMAKEICDAVDLPAITHPVASPHPRYGEGLPLGATLRMCTEIPQIVAWKMTYSYPGYRVIARALRRFPRRIAILAASAVYFHEELATGQFDGAVSGAFLYAMEPMVEHVRAWRRGDLDAARRIWDSGLAELHEYVYADMSRLHVRYKLASWLRGLIPEPFMRPPMPKPGPDEARTLRALLQGAGLEVIDESNVDRIIPGARQ